MDVASFLEQCGIGITSGGFLGLIAVGYTLVYGTVGLIHFAHGDVVMLGGCLSLAILSFLVPLPVDPLTGCLVAVLAAACSGLFCGCLNVCIDQFVYRPLRNAPPLSPLVSTIGVSFVLMNVGLIWIGRLIVHFLRFSWKPHVQLVQFPLRWLIFWCLLSSCPPFFASTFFFVKPVLEDRCVQLLQSPV